MVAQALDITNVINVSVSQTAQALSAFNTSNLALFTTDTAGGSFPAAGFQLYTNALQVAADFGSSSTTTQMATAVFAQSPNILAGGGYLVIIPFLTSETLAAAITRTRNLVSYYGVMAEQIESQADLLAAAALIQSLNMIGFFVSITAADFATGGKLDLLRSGSFTQSRGLYYGSSTVTPALLMQAAYAGRALSVNFSGSNTTTTMHLKPLATISPDPSITQSQLVACGTAGVDTYVSIQGSSVVYCSGTNAYFDEVYNLAWLVGAIQVAGFNYLSGAATKIPQTEAGIDGLKGAYRAVLEQAVTNQYAAPGTWNSATTFGSQADLLANVAQRGYYMYSAPIAQQLTADRAARKAPLVQIALKEAGAIHSSSLIININQ